MMATSTQRSYFRDDKKEATTVSFDEVMRAAVRRTGVVVVS